ncbi:MAG: hypothetical protein K1X85_03795 [Ignavibacteria bacterium]|nr:hypothetical protein [Ignavibacteria bacterium]
MKNSNFFASSISGFAVLLILAFVGFEIFQGQKAPLPYNEAMFNYDESDPYIDRPTREALTHVVETTDDDLDIITDANGFDNFEMGVDYAQQMLVSNPRNPLNMQFGVNNLTNGQNAYYTTDGYNWTQSNPTYHPTTCCNPWSAWDSTGNLFYGSGVSGQYVYKSTNGGQTYGSAVLSVNGNDRNTLAADQTNGPYKNYLYAAITPGNFARSTNGGTNWTQTYTSSNTIPGVMIAVGPNGSTQGGCVMYVTNTGSTENATYTFHRSTNGGANFSVRSSLTVAGFVGTLNSVGRLVINNGRTRPYPMIAMDNSYGPYRGRFYLVYASNVPAGNGNKPDIILQYSDDQGATWSNKVTVNDVTTGDQWFPAIWCEKETGRLYIKWYDTRENPATYAVNVYATYTDNGGTSFAANQKLTTQSWTYPNPSCPPNSNCYRGDYDGMTANPKAGFAVWYDGRLGTYKNVGSYLPDFGLLASPANQNIDQTNDSRNVTISVPSVKLYADVTTFSATVTPTPATGSIGLEFLGGNTLSSYPNTKYLKVRTVGTVTPTGVYTVTVTGQGSNGTPVHKRTVTVNVTNTSNAAPCEDFSNTKFPPAGLYQEYSGTNYWSRNSASAYGIGDGSAKFDFYSAAAGDLQSLVSNNFVSSVAGDYLTFDEAYAPDTSASFGSDTLDIEISNNEGVSWSLLQRLFGRFDGTGELNSAPPTASPFTPAAGQWRPKIYSLPVGTNKIRMKARSGSGNNLYIDNVCVQNLPTQSTNATVELASQGMFIPTNPFWRLQDTIRVYLHRGDLPSVVVDSAVATIEDNAVSNNLVFDKVLSGNYYRVVRHRNSIITWNATPQALTRGVSFGNWNFIQPDSQAYGNNQAIVQKSPLFRGMYSGDVNQDGTIDGTDVGSIDNDAANYIGGYVVTDITGDNFVDGTDFALADNNAANFVAEVAPPGAEPTVLNPVSTDIPPVFENYMQRLKYEEGQKILREQE